MNDSLWMELDYFKFMVEKIKMDLKVSLSWASMSGWREADKLISTIDSLLIKGK